jgi:hypothetical protein
MKGLYKRDLMKNLSNTFYVYLHKKATDGSVFYVGKGKGKRAYSKFSRNIHWKRTVEKYGYFVEIYKDGLLEEEAFKLEEDLILFYGFDSLTNMTLGGHTTTGYSHTEESITKMQEIARQRMQDPKEFERCMNNLHLLHEKQRNDPEYRKEVSERVSNYYSTVSDEEKKVRVAKMLKTMSDPEKRASWIENVKAAQTPEVRAKAAAKSKQTWENLPDDIKKSRVKKLTEFLKSDNTRKRLVECLSEPVVVNRKYIFSSHQELDNYFNKKGSSSNSLRTAIKNGYIGSIYKGHLFEKYDKDTHKDLLPVNGPIGEIFTFTLPTSVAVFANDTLYLSPRHAAVELLGKEGRNIDSTADWLSKKAKANHESFGYTWRVANKDEINNYLIKTVESYHENIH